MPISDESSIGNQSAAAKATARFNIVVYLFLVKTAFHELLFSFNDE
jgi:hypothetical protein